MKTAWMSALVVCAAAFAMGQSAFALEHGCAIHPSQIEGYGSYLVQRAASESRALQDSLVVRFFLGASVRSGGRTSNPTIFEGYFRPLRDDLFSLLPVPLIGIQLSRTRDMFYVCANLSPSARETHVTIYMLKGYHLEDQRWITSIDEWFMAPQVRVAPMTVSLTALGAAGSLLEGSIGQIPLLGLIGRIPARGLQGLNGLFGRAVADFAGIGVERITITANSVEIASGVDLQNPANARVLRVIPFESSPRR